MNGYVFDPRRLACSPKQQERNGYATAARMLREYLGGVDLLTPTAPRLRRRSPGSGHGDGAVPRLDHDGALLNAGDGTASR